MQSSIFNLPFQIVIYHPIFMQQYFSSSVKLMYSDTPGVLLAKKQPYIT